MSNDSEFLENYYNCKDFTQTSIERMYCLHSATKYIANYHIPGDFVECGTWRGGSLMLIAYSLLGSNETARKIYAYDTFEGMAQPTEKDSELGDGNSAYQIWKNKQRKNHNEWCFADLAEVKKNILSTGYPEENIVFIKGKVEDTIPKRIPCQIALLRLDTDWYESTRHELVHLFPLLTKGGILIIDDYGHWAGSKKATDEYISSNNIPIFLVGMDSVAKIGIKV